MRRKPIYLFFPESHNVFVVAPKGVHIAVELLVLDPVLRAHASNDRAEPRVVAVVYGREEMVLDLVVESARHQKMEPTAASVVRGGQYLALVPVALDGWPGL